eukprot:CCRYP_014490-RA/>CCRYP_014490-RA protein AED:0.00 eAED:0.00 QI:35/1/1/1/0/0/3/92/39
MWYEMRVVQLCSFWSPVSALNLRGVAGDAVDLICGMQWD